ncbi:pirin family protein [Roseospira navarrensis]|uniref:Quercetin 2,3-dioxygenase n=1 Tax=Roseospira navarrensis TaxID=140058 RepID=A0A7X1ZBI3_9PROT|nr:pirin family protein [Roseospira navarrensis]MQX35489.1 quercetin 2,3-dioxygenase [Roseospira navarrensis]
MTLDPLARAPTAPPAERRLARVVPGVAASDGAGVKLTRMIGTRALDMLDPFLMLDVLHSDNPHDYIAGFPPHPHRGFETVTYLMAGRVEHRDTLGNAGVIETGGVQWMTAGRGIVHSEMPVQENGLLWGIQLWVNLPAHLKMQDPGYREFPAASIPEETRADGTRLRVVAGTTSEGTAGPVQGVVTDPLFLDVTVPAGGVLREPIPDGHAAFVLMLEGTATIGGDSLAAGRLGVLGPNGTDLALHAGPDGARALVVHARRLDEPVARGGPFVMTTEAEIHQAIRDYQAGRF